MPDTPSDNGPHPLPNQERLVPVGSPSSPRAREKAAGARFVLATDLDGTFLGGREADRHALYSLFRQLGDRALLFFVTGRGLERIHPLLNDPVVPDPDVVIADVGATAVYGDTLEPVQPLQTEIESRWPGMLAVRRALEPWPALRLQDVPQQRRCSFEIDEDAEIPSGVEEAVAELGCGLLRSAGRYLDVLPRGVDKGTTLRGLLELLDLPDARVVVAGDTLNDEALFDLGLKGICVGEAEEGLRAAVAGRSQVHVSERPGAGGILEGLEAFNLLDENESGTSAPHAVGEAQLLMVYHRLPFDEVHGPGGTERRRPKSPNGIIPSLLRFFADGRSGAWVAWSMQPSRDTKAFEAQVPVDEEAYPRLTASRIPLTAEDVTLFYKQFSKEAFWPIIFSFPSRAVFDAEHWLHYLEINRLFAERVAREAERDALVWVHEYNLWMVPGHLRQLRPDLRIAFFHHTAFPPADIFGVLPWRYEIVGSLLACDYIGFHVPRYVENFVDVVKAHGPSRVLAKQPCAPRYVTYGCALGVEEVTREIEVAGRRVGLGAHPVGVDVQRISSILATDRTRRRIAELEEELGDGPASSARNASTTSRAPSRNCRPSSRSWRSTPSCTATWSWCRWSHPPPRGWRSTSRPGRTWTRRWVESTAASAVSTGPRCATSSAPCPSRSCWPTTRWPTSPGSRPCVTG